MVWSRRCATFSRAIAIVCLAATTSVLTGCGQAAISRASYRAALASAASQLTVAARQPVPAAVAVASRHDSGHHKGHSFAWTSSYAGVCVDMVRTANVRRAVRALTDDHVKRFTRRRAVERWVDASKDYSRGWIAGGRVGAWTFLWEDNGYLGSLNKTARAVSAHARYTSVFWDVNDDENFIDASHGRIVRSFDPIFYPTAGTGKRLRAERGLHWRRQPEVSMLRLQSALTGRHAANPSWLRRNGVSYWGTTE